MSKVLELFGNTTRNSEQIKWSELLSKQNCPYLHKKCIKVRKSNPEISIGTCSVIYGREENPIIICPFRLLERNKIFIDESTLKRAN